MDNVTVLPDGRLQLATPVALPEILDVLIVGGGPAGTAAGFRAKELGLAALVIEIDDLMKRIRDYDQRKPIKPDFGAGKQMGFPKGGDLVERLHFFSDISSSELCRNWTALYRDHSVPAQIGVELMGLEPDPDPAREGVWVAQLRNHRTASNDIVRAKHVVLALGAGMPRRLDVPGDVRAISDRLAGADRYVGATACVIGGGVSAIEAVIAISAAKAAARDDTAVYWSHRGERQPPVPKALKPALAEAIDGHGNVRFLPASEAREIVERPAGKLLRLQKRQETPSEPADPTVLEFETQHVVACIGQEIDWGLIHGIGIYQVTGGPRGKKAIPLNALLESRQPNVYVIGDTLNIAYLECDDYDGDASMFQEVKHQGNIKASLTDGVTVAEVIAQKLEGRAEIRVELEFVEGSQPASGTASGASPAGEDVSTLDATLPGRSQALPSAVLVRLLDREVEAEQFPVSIDRETSIGRRRCDVSFADDTRMADRHATLLPDGDGYLVRDESAREGVFLHLTDGSGRAVTPGTVGRVGGQWLVFGSTADPLLLGQYDPRGHLVAQFRLREGPRFLVALRRTSR